MISFLEINQIYEKPIVYGVPHCISSGFSCFIDNYVDDSDESDVAEPDNGDGRDSFMQSYSDVMNDELKATTLGRSFVQANEQIPKKDEVFCLYLCMEKNVLNV